MSATLDPKTFFTEEKLKLLFRYFDIDDSGYITADNLKEAMAREGRELPDDVITSMIEEGDYEKNNQIDFIEFTRMMNVGEKNYEFKKWRANGSFENLLQSSVMVSR